MSSVGTAGQDGVAQVPYVAYGFEFFFYQVEVLTKHLSASCLAVVKTKVANFKATN